MMFPALIVNPSLCSDSQSKYPRRIALLNSVPSVHLLSKLCHVLIFFCDHFVNEMGVVNKNFRCAFTCLGNGSAPDRAWERYNIAQNIIYQ